MDKYKKLMAVKGLIMSMDERIYRLDNDKNQEMRTKHHYAEIIDGYYKAIIDFLNGKDENNGEKA